MKRISFPHSAASSLAILYTVLSDYCQEKNCLSCLYFWHCRHFIIEEIQQLIHLVKAQRPFSQYNLTLKAALSCLQPPHTQVLNL